MVTEVSGGPEDGDTVKIEEVISFQYAPLEFVIKTSIWLAVLLLKYSDHFSTPVFEG